MTNFIKFDTIKNMDIIQKLQFIKQITGLTQTKLAERLGVTFVTFNSWWTGKSTPRPKIQKLIDEREKEKLGGLNPSADPSAKIKMDKYNFTASLHHQ